MSLSNYSQESTVSNIRRKSSKKEKLTSLFENKKEVIVKDAVKTDSNVLIFKV